MSQVQQTGTPINLSASGVISVVPGNMVGFYVNSTAGGTLVLRNGGASGTAVTGTITPVIGYHRFPAYFTTACYATIAVAGLDVTFFFAAG